MSVNGRELDSKERKNCARRAYIFTVMVAQTILWIVMYTVFYDIIYYAFVDEWLMPVCLGVFLCMDVAFIKAKNMKYAYKSYLRDDNEYKVCKDPEAQYAQNAIYM